MRLELVHHQMPIKLSIVILKWPNFIHNQKILRNSAIKSKFPSKENTTEMENY